MILTSRFVVLPAEVYALFSSNMTLATIRRMYNYRQITALSPIIDNIEKILAKGGLLVGSIVLTYTHSN